MKPVLIFSGNNQRAVIAFCRFSIEKNIDFYIIANSAEDSILNSQYKDRVIFIREKNKLTIEDTIKYTSIIKENSKQKEVFILPSTEYLNRFLLEHKNVLNENKISFGLCKKETYQLVSNKLSFSNYCKNNGIKTPKEFNSFPSHYPYIIKPKKYQNSNNKIDNPAVITNEKDFENYWKNKNIEDYYIQEYIGGGSFYLLFYFFKNGDYKVYSQENLIQQHNGGSMILSKSSNIHNKNIAKQFANVLQKEGFHGIIMIEIKFFNNQFYMIEANPRLWGPSQLIIDANMGLFDCFAYENNLINKMDIQEYKNDTMYFWQGGLTINRKDGVPLTYYNYTPDDFKKTHHELIQIEIYNKKDTIEIYNKENER